MIRIMRMGQVPEEELFSRAQERLDVSGPVREIIENVRVRGDEALREYCGRFDGGAPESLEVTPEEMDAALSSLEPELLGAMERAAENIAAFHRRQLREGFTISPGRA